jgi:hypothetical protein
MAKLFQWNASQFFLKFRIIFRVMNLYVRVRQTWIRAPLYCREVNIPFHWAIRVTSPVWPRKYRIWSRMKLWKNCNKYLHIWNDSRALITKRATRIEVDLSLLLLWSNAGPKFFKFVARFTKADQIMILGLRLLITSATITWSLKN